MTPYVEAWNAFKDSKEWKDNTEPGTLHAPERMRTYLENRIHRTFDAGWNAGLEQAAKHPNGESPRE